MTQTNKNMEYRRFGKTEKMLSAITLGGMRYHHMWDAPFDSLASDTIDQCRIAVECAIKSGINHIETAHGYGKSENCYGLVLNKELSLPRDSYYLMTKGNPKTAEETRSLVEKQLKALQTDYIDFYAWHGINTQEIHNDTLGTGGPVEELLKLKEEGVIGHVGFSTHGPCDIIIGAIESGAFDFVNLHYYYFLQRNKAAVDAAAKRDMGVFIISPNDKGGQLFNPPPLLETLTSPLTPIQWNARFCLSSPSVHTLSFGMTEPEHFEKMERIFSGSDEIWTDEDKKILHRMQEQLGKNPYSSFDGYDIEDKRSGINIPEVLRHYKMWKCYDMAGWCDYRYNMFEEKGHWFPGCFATDENIDKIDDAVIPEGLPLKEILREFHAEFYKAKKESSE